MMLIACVLGILSAGDAAPAGMEYMRGLKLLEEKKYAEAAAAIEEALRHEAMEWPVLRYRTDGGRHKHPYYPYYDLARARLAQVQGEPSPFVRRERLQTAARLFGQTTHPDGAARATELVTTLEAIEKEIAEAEAATVPPEVQALRTKVERLCDQENFVEAQKELDGGAALLQRYDKVKTALVTLLRNRQNTTINRYDVFLTSRLESVTRSDPTLEADTLLPLLTPARLPAEVSATPAARFRWLQEFCALYEKEIERLKAATTLAPDALLASAALFEEAARKALDIDLITGFRASRNVAHSMRIARQREYLASGNPGDADYQPSTKAIDAAAEEVLKGLETALQERLAAAGDTPAAKEMKRYAEVDIAYQRRQMDAVRKRIAEEVLAYERRVAADKIVSTAETALLTPEVMSDPAECRKVSHTLGVLESQVYFETLPAPIRARLLYARAVAEATSVFLEAETRARVVERSRGDILKAYGLDAKVDAPWRDTGRLSPRVLAIFDSIKKE